MHLNHHHDWIRWVTGRVALRGYVRSVSPNFPFNGSRTRICWNLHLITEHGCRNALFSVPGPWLYVGNNCQVTQPSILMSVKRRMCLFIRFSHMIITRLRLNKLITFGLVWFVEIWSVERICYNGSYNYESDYGKLFAFGVKKRRKETSSNVVCLVGWVITIIDDDLNS